MPLKPGSQKLATYSDDEAEEEEVEYDFWRCETCRDFAGYFG